MKGFSPRPVFQLIRTSTRITGYLIFCDSLSLSFPLPLFPLSSLRSLTHPREGTILKQSSLPGIANQLTRPNVSSYMYIVYGELLISLSPFLFPFLSPLPLFSFSGSCSMWSSHCIGELISTHYYGVNPIPLSPIGCWCVQGSGHVSWPCLNLWYVTH